MANHKTLSLAEVEDFATRLMGFLERLRPSLALAERHHRIVEAIGNLNKQFHAELAQIAAPVSAAAAGVVAKGRGPVKGKRKAARGDGPSEPAVLDFVRSASRPVKLRDIYVALGAKPDQVAYRLKQLQRSNLVKATGKRPNMVYSVVGNGHAAATPPARKPGRPAKKPSAKTKRTTKKAARAAKPTTPVQTGQIAKSAKTVKNGKRGRKAKTPPAKAGSSLSDTIFELLKKAAGGMKISEILKATRASEYHAKNALERLRADRRVSLVGNRSQARYHAGSPANASA